MSTPISPLSKSAPPVPTITTEGLPLAPEEAVQPEQHPELRRVTLVDAPLPPDPPKYQQSSGQSFLKAPVISISKTKSEGNMHRAFSLRRSKSGSKATSEKPTPA